MLGSADPPQVEWERDQLGLCLETGSGSPFVSPFVLQGVGFDGPSMAPDVASKASLKVGGPRWEIVGGEVDTPGAGPRVALTAIGSGVGTAI